MEKEHSSFGERLSFLAQETTIAPLRETVLFLRKKR